MTKSIFKKLAAVTVGTTLMFGLAEAMPAQAAVLIYSFSNTSKTLTGSFSFDSATASDQFVTVSEGLKINANYLGTTYTEANDSGAFVLTADSLGSIPNGQFLGLSFVLPNFTVAQDSFIDAAGNVQSVTYSSVPVPEPGSILGLSVLGLGLLAGRKAQSSKISSIKA